MASVTEGMDAFRARFDGEVVLPGEGGYDEARSVWNGDIDRRPALIARCTTPAHVAAAIDLARREGLELSVRGGGHNFGGSGVCDGGVMIHLGGMNAVSVDPAARRARVAGGATWAALDAATAAHGLAVTGGFISHTGVGGLTLGGGMAGSRAAQASPSTTSSRPSSSSPTDASSAHRPTSTRTSSGRSAGAAATSAS